MNEIKTKTSKNDFDNFSDLEKHIALWVEGYAITNSVLWEPPLPPHQIEDKGVASHRRF